ncbi:hypothetical protein [Pedobacter gandavensis]|uniref:Phage tail protein n=1 Tax=Pedobacter gandavensis TaxID=2679963 RepID=A0ABR6EUD3_9SPHI|nr:hypothetical protein [Pedobacter gandavensis]MBB2148807.1 hypothetical protein [Pedobacter gandavensis]
MSQAVTGVKSVELAPMGLNGAMPTTGWVKIVDIEDDSVSFTVPPLETLKFRVEEKGGVRFVLPGETEGATFAFKSLDLAGAKAKLLLGGDWDDVEQEYNYPANPDVLYLAVRLTSNAFQGKAFQLSIPAAAGTAGVANNFTKKGFIALSYSGEATTPADALGEAVSPWGYKFIDVPAIP